MPVYQAHTTAVDSYNQYAKDYKPFDLADTITQSMRVANEMTVAQQNIQRTNMQMAFDSQLEPLKVQETKMRIDKMAQDKRVTDLTMSEERIRAKMLHDDEVMKLETIKVQADAELKSSEASEHKAKAENLKMSKTYLDQITSIDEQINEINKASMEEVKPEDTEDMIGGKKLEDLFNDVERKPRKQTFADKLNLGVESLFHTPEQMSGRRVAMRKDLDPAIQDELMHHAEASGIDVNDLKSRVNSTDFLATVKQHNDAINAAKKARDPQAFIVATQNLKTYLSSELGAKEDFPIKKAAVINNNKYKELQELLAKRMLMTDRYNMITGKKTPAAPKDYTIEQTYTDPATGQPVRKVTKKTFGGSSSASGVSLPTYTPEEASQLEPGTRFIGTDGVERVR